MKTVRMHKGKGARVTLGPQDAALVFRARDLTVDLVLPHDRETRTEPAIMAAALAWGTIHQHPAIVALVKTFITQGIAPHAVPERKGGNGRN